MTAGDVVRVRFTNGQTADLLLDDKVFPDRTCGQYDEGFWAHAAEEETREFFVSQLDGAVWSHPANRIVGDIETVSTLQDTDA